jgi:hypothetical protein
VSDAAALQLRRGGGGGRPRQAATGIGLTAARACGQYVFVQRDGGILMARSHRRKPSRSARWQAGLQQTWREQRRQRDREREHQGQQSDQHRHSAHNGSPAAPLVQPPALAATLWAGWLPDRQRSWRMVSLGWQVERVRQAAAEIARRWHLDDRAVKVLPLGGEPDQRLAGDERLLHSGMRPRGFDRGSLLPPPAPPRPRRAKLVFCSTHRDERE